MPGPKGKSWAALKSEQQERVAAEVANLPAVVPLKDTTPRSLIHELCVIYAQCEQRAGLLSIESRDFTMLMEQKVRAIKEISRMTGAYQKPNPLDLLPLWNRLREAIFRALAPHPEAFEAVREAVLEIEKEMR